MSRTVETRDSALDEERRAAARARLEARRKAAGYQSRDTAGGNAVARAEMVAADAASSEDSTARGWTRNRRGSAEFDGETIPDSSSAYGDFAAESNEVADDESAKAKLSPEPMRTTRTGEPKETKHRAQKVKERAYEKTPERFKNASSFQVRLRTGIVYISLNIICILVSDITTMIILAATAAVCAGEFYYMLRSDAKMPNEVIGIIAAAAYPVMAYFLGVNGLLVVTLALLLAVTVWYVYWLRARVSDVGVCVFGAMYTGLQLSGLVFIRMSIPGVWGGVLVMVIFASIWFNDAGAYLFGSKFGKHKLAPRTSPNKSWEGFIAGLVVSMGFWCILLVIPGVHINVWECLLFGLICGLTSVLGDLCESRIKRSVGFKDSGNIMPGHGGLFDRCDSLMPTAVASALLLFGAGCLPMPF